MRLRLSLGLALGCAALAASCGGGGGGNPPPQNQTPTASFVADSAGGLVPLIVNFDAAASTDPDGTIASFEWDFDGDGTVDLTRTQPDAQFTFTTAGSLIPRLRVVDDDGASGSTTRTLDFTALTLAEENIDQGAFGIFGDIEGTAAINGRPALAFASNSEALFFAMDDDALDPSWPAPVAVGPTSVREPQLLAVSGNPAILYLDALSNDLNYVRADDSAGTTWPTPTVLSTDTFAGSDFTLHSVNGRPAAIFEVGDGFASTSLVILRADDDLGGSWPAAPVVIHAGPSVGRSVGVLANGNPAAFLTPGGDIQFIRALDADGTQWPAETQLVLADPGDIDGELTAAELAGGPAVAFTGGGGTRFIAATEPSGATFANPVEFTNLGDGDLDALRLVAVGGRPVMVGASGALESELIVFVATDALGTRFSGPLELPQALGQGKVGALGLGDALGVYFISQSGLLRFGLGQL